MAKMLMHAQSVIPHKVIFLTQMLGQIREDYMHGCL